MRSACRSLSSALMSMWCHLSPAQFNEAILIESLSSFSQASGLLLRQILFILFNSFIALFDVLKAFLASNLPTMKTCWRSSTLLSITYPWASSHTVSKWIPTLSGFGIVCPWILWAVMACASLTGNCTRLADDPTVPPDFLIVYSLGHNNILLRNSCLLFGTFMRSHVSHT